MEFSRKVIVTPFEMHDSKQKDTKSKSDKGSKILRLLLHVARNGGYDNEGKLIIDGHSVPSSDIISLINNAVLPVKILPGEDLFIRFLKSTHVSPELVVNQIWREKLVLNASSQELGSTQHDSQSSGYNDRIAQVSDRQPIVLTRTAIESQTTRNDKEDDQEDDDTDHEDEPPRKYRATQIEEQAEEPPPRLHRGDSVYYTTQETNKSSLGPLKDKSKRRKEARPQLYSKARPRWATIDA